MKINKLVFRTIAFVLIQTFVCFDFCWAESGQLKSSLAPRVQLGSLQEMFGHNGGKTIDSDEETANITPEQTAKTIAITGISGDIGTALVARIAREGNYPVRGLVMGNDPRKEELAKFHKNLACYSGDVFSISAIKKMISKSGRLYHLAGMVGHDFTPEQQAMILAVNGFGTGVIASLIKSSGKEINMIYASSQRAAFIANRSDVTGFVQTAYQRFNQEMASLLGMSETECKIRVSKISEDLVKTLPPGVNIYDLSKLLGEKFVEDLEHKTILRISNAYGEDFTAKRLIPRIIEARLDDQTIEINDESRDFIYQDDLIEILLKIGLENGLPDIVDIASGVQTTADELVRLIEEFTPYSLGDIIITGPKQYTVRQGNRICRKLLGRDFTTLRAGLEKIIKNANMPQPEKDPGRLQENKIIQQIKITIDHMPANDQEARRQAGKDFARFIRNNEYVSALRRVIPQIVANLSRGPDSFIGETAKEILIELSRHKIAAERLAEALPGLITYLGNAGLDVKIRAKDIILVFIRQAKGMPQVHNALAEAVPDLIYHLTHPDNHTREYAKEILLAVIENRIAEKKLGEAVPDLVKFLAAPPYTVKTGLSLYLYNNISYHSRDIIIALANNRIAREELAAAVPTLKDYISQVSTMEYAREILSVFKKNRINKDELSGFLNPPTSRSELRKAKMRQRRKKIHDLIKGVLTRMRGAPQGVAQSYEPSRTEMIGIGKEAFLATEQAI